MKFYFQSNSVMNSLKCPKSKSLSYCLTELFTIYQNKHWTIRQWDNCSIHPSFHHITLKTVGFLFRPPRSLQLTDDPPTFSEPLNHPRFSDQLKPPEPSRPTELSRPCIKLSMLF